MVLQHVDDVVVARDRPHPHGRNLMDGLVLARSAFNSSMNYRSVTVFGSAALLVGVAQAIAVAPGISRSGATIVAADISPWIRVQVLQQLGLLLGETANHLAVVDLTTLEVYTAGQEWHESRRHGRWYITTALAPRANCEGSKLECRPRLRRW